MFIFESQLVEKLFSENRFIFDDNYKDIKFSKPAFPNIKERSKKQIRAEYIRTTKDGIILFKTNSGTTPGLFWYQQIKLLDFKKNLSKYKNKEYPRKIVERSVKGNIKLSCNDPSWKYWGFKYKAFVNGYGIDKEIRFPKVRNPMLFGSVCKHLYQVLTVLPFHMTKITSDLERQGVFK